MNIISIHKKKSGRKNAGYTWNRPPVGKKRAMVIINGKTKHIDIDI